MICFSKLPEIAIHRIYYYATSNIADIFRPLVYVSICSHWRDTLLPHVYSRASIAEINDAKIELNTEPLGLSRRVWSTNLELIKTMGYFSNVRIVYISIKTCNGLLDFNKNAYAFFIRTAGYLNQVLDLTIDLRFVFKRSDMAQVEQISTDLADMLARLMPNVVRMNYTSDYFDRFATPFGNRLIQCNSRNLKHLRSEAYVDLDYAFPFDSITHLHVPLDDNFVGVHSVINPASLRLLNLDIYMPGFSWRLFTNNDSVVYFDALETLVLHYWYDTEMSFSDDSQVVASFPKLDTMYVSDYPDSTLFIGCVFPHVLKNVKTDNSSRLLSQIGDALVNASARPLYFDITSADEESCEYSTLNYVFGGDTLLHNARLNINIDFEMSRESLNWTGLASLVISSKHNCGYVYLLLSQLSALRHIDIYYIDATTTSASDFFDICRYSDSLVPPINTSVTNFIIRNITAESSDKALVFLMFLLSGLPNVVVFKSSANILVGLKSEIPKLSNKYQHFRNLLATEF